MSVVLAHRHAAVASAMAMMLRTHGSLNFGASVSRTEDILPAVQAERSLLALVDPLLPGLGPGSLRPGCERTAPHWRAWLWWPVWGIQPSSALP